jgi:hypothetical protein
MGIFSNSSFAKLKVSLNAFCLGGINGTGVVSKTLTHPAEDILS